MFFFPVMASPGNPTEPYPDRTTPAEHEIIDGILAGLTTREIAKRRGCSPRTVTTQLTALFQKTGVHSQAELAAFISEDLLSRNLTRGCDFARLTERQTTVVTHAAHGESSKLIAHRLGISRSTVSIALHRAMRELGVKTQAELVAKTHGL
jgi:DNA-binding CsgD family transcriptional regulator